MVKQTQNACGGICRQGISLLKTLLFLCLVVTACSKEESRAAVVYDIKAETLKCRDPFIYLHEPSGIYYLHVNGGGKIKCYTSPDLQNWRYECDSFIPEPDFWGKQDFWAPDMYEYKGRYYLFVTFSAQNAKRGVSVLESNRPEGPFFPLTNSPITPEDQMCLDGSLYIDEEGTPWMIYCREWLEAIDGEIYAAQMTKDLSALKGEPKLLFRASEAPWVGDITSGNVTGKVTDAPFIIRQESGRLIMTWSSFRADNGRYAVGQAYSEEGLLGPWYQVAAPLISGGGHAMFFKNKAGRLMTSYHAPNTAPSFLKIRKAYIYQDKLLVE